MTPVYGAQGEGLLTTAALSVVSSMEQMRVFAAFHHLHPRPAVPAPVMCKTKAARVSRVDTTLLHTHQHATHHPRCYQLFQQHFFQHFHEEIIKSKENLRKSLKVNL